MIPNRNGPNVTKAVNQKRVVDPFSTENGYTGTRNRSLNEFQQEFKLNHIYQFKLFIQSCRNLNRFGDPSFSPFGSMK